MAFNRQEHQEIIGFLQLRRQGRFWMGIGTRRMVTSRKERSGKSFLIADVAKMEEECYKIRAVSQQQQRSWTTWGGCDQQG